MHLKKQIHSALPAMQYISIEEYLAMEETAAEKHEYYGGEVSAMAGASTNHNRIVRNVLTSLDNFLRGKDCEVFPSDLKVHIEKNSLFSYPDISVVCGELETRNNRNDVIINPVVIMEVLSKKTVNYDRGEKFKLYRDIPSLQEYILISSAEYLIENFTKQSEPSWTFTEGKGLDNALQVQKIGFSVDAKEIYRDVTVPAKQKKKN